MKLSTRPEGYLGELETWNKAETALESALNASGKEWELNPATARFTVRKLTSPFLTIEKTIPMRHGPTRFPTPHPI